MKPKESVSCPRTNCQWQNSDSNPADKLSYHSSSDSKQCCLVKRSLSHIAQNFPLATFFLSKKKQMKLILIQADFVLLHFTVLLFIHVAYLINFRFVATLH